MAEPKVIVGEGAERKRPTGGSADPDKAWRWVGWFALALAVAGVSDFLLAWYPLRMGNPEWEFSTVVQTFSGLPLVTMGFAGLLAAGIARGTRWLAQTMAWILVIWGVALLVALVLFFTNVPMALNQATGTAAIGVQKAVVKTLILGLTFGLAYIVGAIAAFRHMKRTQRG